MLGHNDIIYDWQIVRKTEKSFLVFLFFDTRTAPVKENKNVHVWVPKKLCSLIDQYYIMKNPDDFTYTMVNARNEEYRITGKQLHEIISKSSCSYDGYENVPKKREAIKIEAIDELKR